MDLYVHLPNANYRRPQSKRRAMTLVELMVVATVSSVLLSIVVCFLVSLQRWDRRARASSVDNERTFRMANSLRADLRRAANVSLTAPGTLTINGSENRQTQYAIQSDGCHRRVKRPGEAADKQTELFAIGPGRTWRLDEGPLGRFPSVIVSLEVSASHDSAEAMIPLVVCASVGADRMVVEPTDQDTQPPTEPQ